MFSSEERGSFLSGCRCVFMWGLLGLKAQTGTLTPPAYWPGFMLVPKGKTIPPPLAFPKRTQYKLRGVKVCQTYLLLPCLLHNLIRHKPNGWAAIKMVFTSPSYMLVTQYSALVEFKTCTRPSWAGPVPDMPALWLRELTGSQTQRRDSHDASRRRSGLIVFWKEFK